jgi:hypothetical protein
MSTENDDGVVRVGPIRVWYDQKVGVAIATFDEGAELTMEHTRPFTAALVKVTKGRVRPLLVDFKNMKSQTKECRDYYSSDPQHIATLSAAALVVNSALQRMIANFFLGMNKSVKPVRLFDDRESAIKWLQEIEAQNRR